MAGHEGDGGGVNARLYRADTSSSQVDDRFDLMDDRFDRIENDIKILINDIGELKGAAGISSGSRVREPSGTGD